MTVAMKIRHPRNLRAQRAFSLQLAHTRRLGVLPNGVEAAHRSSPQPHRENTRYKADCDKQARLQNALLQIYLSSSAYYRFVLSPPLAQCPRETGRYGPGVRQHGRQSSHASA
jgi:hypothetical protein